MSKRSKQSLNRSVGKIERLANDSSPAVSIKYASDFSSVEDKSLIKVAKIIAEKREGISKQIESTIKDIESRYVKSRRKSRAEAESLNKYSTLVMHRYQ